MKFYIEDSSVLSKSLHEDIWNKEGTIYQPLKDSKYLRLQRKPINTLTLEDIVYLYAIRWAGYSRGVYYDSSEDAINKIVDEDDLDIFKECHKWLSGLTFPLTLYRGIRKDEIDSESNLLISGHNWSHSWTTDINIYKDIHSKFKNLNDIVTCKIDSDIIDNANTITNFYYYTGRDIVLDRSNYGEWEITLKKNFKQSDLQDLHLINKEKITEDLKLIKDHFGTTYYKSAAFYLLTDGTLLDGSDYKNGSGSCTRRTLDHREISDVYDGDMYDFINEGNIRLMPESPGITLIKEPTEEQYIALKSYVENFLFKDKVFYVDIVNKKGYNIKSFEYSWPENKSMNIINGLVDYFK